MLRHVTVPLIIIAACISKQVLCQSDHVIESINGGTNGDQSANARHSLNDECVQTPSIHDDNEGEKSQEIEQQQDNHNTTSQNLNRECECLPYDASQSSRIAYLIALHNKRTLEDGLSLLKSIIAPGFIVFIHIDKKLPEQEYLESELKKFIDEKTCNYCGADIFVDKVYDVEWGRWSMNKPTLWGECNNIFLSKSNHTVLQLQSHSRCCLIIA